MMERYSDSAAAYVFLESSNLPVYKQLYRAAKAKSKLKLRVTLLNGPKKTTANKPVSPELRADIMPGSLPISLSQTSLPIRSAATSSVNKTYDASLLTEAAKLAKQHGEEEFTARLHGLLQGAASPVTHDDNQRAPAPTPVASFAVCCNSCDRTVPDAHYHCSSCDDGDFDLCQSCIDQGITCYSDNHWLIRRTIVNGAIVRSSTEKIAPKPKAASPKPQQRLPPVPQEPMVQVAYHLCHGGRSAPVTTEYVRTCNGCLSELAEDQFLHCQACEDFDLCKSCFSKDDHGHHPAHAFAPAVPGTQMPEEIVCKLAPGRNKIHLAICDGCDKNISGVRHKCLDCADWDYCSDCMASASFVHPNHRFVPIYEPLADIKSYVPEQVIHMGTTCDGPLCATAGWPSYIRGARYKCAVCHDVDYCANCESSPSNTHDKSHPMIKFSSPVRHVSVTTTGEQSDGKPMPTLGDRYLARRNPYDIFDIESQAILARLTVQPQDELVPCEPVLNIEKVKAIEAAMEKSSNRNSDASATAKAPETESKLVKDLATREASVPAAAAPAAPATPATPTAPENLVAVFVREAVSDSTIMAPNQVFEQTWVLRNEGTTSWPAGCAVQYIGGDYMGHVDSAHPAGISELVSASKSTVCYSPLAPGQEFAFNVLLRTPNRTGKFISHWRLVTDKDEKFGNRLWCEINVRNVKKVPRHASVKTEEQAESEEADPSSLSGSNMIFPKLEKESPLSSMHESLPTQAQQPADAEEEEQEEDAPSGMAENDWDEASDDGFMTDEEYDILDASDEEYLEEHNRKMAARK